MKLRNKKTGEIITSKDLLTDEFIIDLFSKDFNYFNSKLDKIVEDWEDYKEPKEWWYIDCIGSIKHGDGLFIEKSYINDIQEIGNYFETKEEAEKAVEKLKAWKRLKDKRFEFKGIKNGLIDWDFNNSYGDMVAAEKCLSDFRLLFGGGE